MAAVTGMAKKQNKSRQQIEPIDSDVPAVEAIRGVTSLPALPVLDGHMSSVTAVFRRSLNFQRLNDLPTAGLVNHLLSHHHETADKHLMALIFAKCGASILGDQTFAVYALAYDFDCGLAYQHIRDCVLRSGACAVLHTTHNHDKCNTRVRASEIEGHLTTSGQDLILTDGAARQICASISKYGHLTGVVAGDHGRSHEHKGDTFYTLVHEPVKKFRVIFLLAVPIPINEVGLDGYKAIYNGFGGQTFGSGAYDLSCSNANRLFYYMSKPIGSTVEHFVEYINAPLLEWRPTWTTVVASVTAARTREAAQPREVECDDETLQDLAHILNHIPPSAPRPEWFQALGGLHHACAGSEAGLELAHEWSSGSDNYEPDEVDELWDWFANSKSARKATLGTLIYLARKYHPSFRMRQRRHPGVDSVNAAYRDMVSAKLRDKQ